MTRTLALLMVIFAAVLAGLGGGATSAQQDKYTLQVPNGLKFSDFRGYENWQVVAVSQTDDLLKVMVANPTMIDAYRSGVPGNGKLFPDGSKIAKIEWKPKKSTESPFAVRIPASLQDIFLIEKDTKRFPDTKGWAYAVFDYNPASDNVHARSDRRRQLWVHVPYDRGQEGLHFHRVRDTVTRPEKQNCQERGHGNCVLAPSHFPESSNRKIAPKFPVIRLHAHL